MDARGDLPICHGASRRLHMGDEMRRIVVAGLGYMDFLPDPGCRLFLGVAGFNMLRPFLRYPAPP